MGYTYGYNLCKRDISRLEKVRVDQLNVLLRLLGETCLVDLIGFFATLARGTRFVDI